MLVLKVSGVDRELWVSWLLKLTVSAIDRHHPLVCIESLVRPYNLSCSKMVDFLHVEPNLLAPPLWGDVEESFAFVFQWIALQEVQGHEKELHIKVFGLNTSLVNIRVLYIVPKCMIYFRSHTVERLETLDASIPGAGGGSVRVRSVDQLQTNGQHFIWRGFVHRKL